MPQTDEHWADCKLKNHFLSNWSFNLDNKWDNQVIPFASIPKFPTDKLIVHTTALSLILNKNHFVLGWFFIFYFGRMGYWYYKIVWFLSDFSR